MKQKTNQNDSAFPVVEGPTMSESEGISKLEYFTGQAIQGFCTRSGYSADFIATRSVEVAKLAILKLNMD